ncbi:MAG: oligosaccharyl transferase, archaeosortase A system-associated, partial [Methanosarcinales archaeon]
STSGYYGQAEIGYKQVYNNLYKEYLEPVQTGYVKIFEYVKGAKIIGSAQNGTKVEINTTIKTNQGRNFLWNRIAIANESGIYEFIVPYSTEGPLHKSGYTNFDTMPTQPYTITFGNSTKVVHVSEIDVMDGRVVKLK